MPFDPAKLLRQTWDNPNDLAYELYLMLSQLAQPKPQASAHQSASEPQGRRPPTSGPSGGPFIVRTGPPATVTSTPGSPVPLPSSQPQTLADLSRRLNEATTAARRTVGLVGPSPPVETAATVNRPPPERPDLSLPPATSARQPNPLSQAIRSEFQAAAASFTALGSVALTTSSLEPLSTAGTSGPVEPPKRREPVQGVASTPRQADIRVKTPAPELTRTDTRATSPPALSRGTQVPESSGRRVPFDVGQDATQAPAQAVSSTQSDDYPDITIPTQDMWGQQALQLVYITADGIPGMQTSGSQMTPGSGQAYQMSFDGSGLVKAGDQLDIWNYGVLPISGNQVWPARVMNGALFAEPATLCHAITTSGGISPCSGTTPGGGQVQTYYMASGGMTKDQTLNCESWFNINAPGQTHCTVMVVDGTIGLEVLDCPSS